MVAVKGNNIATTASQFIVGSVIWHLYNMCRVSLRQIQNSFLFAFIEYGNPLSKDKICLCFFVYVQSFRNTEY